MLHKCAGRIADWSLQYSEVDGDHEIVAYGVECWLTDTLQILILAMVGILLHRPIEMLCYCICFTSLKQNVGGYHAPNHFWCITIFTALASGASLLARWLPQSVAQLLALTCAVLTVTAVLFIRPKPHPNHPKSTGSQQQSRKRSRWIVLTQAVAVTAGMGLAPSHSSFWLAGALGGTAAALSLIITKLERREKRENNGYAQKKAGGENSSFS